MNERKKTGYQADYYWRRGDVETRRRGDRGRGGGRSDSLLSHVSCLSFISSFSCLCVLNGKNIPQISEHDQRQRHSQQEASLRDEQHDHRVSPSELITDRVILGQMHYKIEEAFCLRPIIAKEP